MYWNIINKEIIILKLRFIMTHLLIRIIFYDSLIPIVAKYGKTKLKYIHNAFNSVGFIAIKKTIQNVVPINGKHYIDEIPDFCNDILKYFIIYLFQYLNCNVHI